MNASATPDAALLSKLLGYPFDVKEMRQTEISGNLKIGDHVWFDHCTKKTTGFIRAIGENAKWNGESFTAILICFSGAFIVKTEKEVELVDYSQCGFY